MRTSGTSALKPDGRYTVADYKSWTDDVRRELIDGIVYEMSPAPGWHIRTSSVRCSLNCTAISKTNPAARSWRLLTSIS
jgi:hypothetical protein